MDVESGVLRNVSWRDCCPWLILVRAVRLAIGLQVLLIAATGALINMAGWRLASTWFLEDEDLQQDALLLDDVEHFGRWPSAWIDRGENPTPPFSRPAANDSLGSQPDQQRVGLGQATDSVRSLAEKAPPEPLSTVAFRFVQPARRLFDVATTWRSMAYYLFGLIWTVMVWGLLGGIITRVAAVYLAREERIGLREAWDHARQKWGSHLAAPALPLLGVVVLAMPMVALGGAMRLDLGLLLVGLLWLPVLVGGFLMTVLLLGLLFGWPLMWGTIATEGSDAFDAISRSYAYTFQQPFRYLFYVTVAALFGLLGSLLVWGVSESTVHLAYWGTGWGAGSARIVAVRNDADFYSRTARSGVVETERQTVARQDGRLTRAGVALLGLSVALVRTVTSAFAYSYFWCVAAAIYLLLRNDVDHTEMDDVHLENEGQSYGLPSLSRDKAGVPGIEEPPAAAAPSEADESNPGAS